MAVRIQIPPFAARFAQRTRDLSRRFADRLKQGALGRPRLTRAGLIAAVPVAWLAIGAVAWFTYDVTHTLPGRREVRGMTSRRPGRVWVTS